MKCLLDSHSFLWAVFDPDKLSEPARDAIVRPENDVFVSVVTFWEISLKYGLGKLLLPKTDPEDLPGVAKQMGMNTLDLNPLEAAGFHRLPGRAHRDPFDRLLFWQAIQRKLTLISKDRALDAYSEYGLRTFW
ncbi:MAG: type II toxin-antitoxin system VapC family toxin [Thermodesulfobacteriota bacterium]